MDKKLKMNNKKFTAIWSVVLALLLVIAIVATYLMNFFSLSMEIFLGRGEMEVTTAENMKNADTEYYDSYDGDSTEHANEVALAIAEEGQVLFKNNGVLPLDKGSSVTPFGYRYVSPVYGGSGSAGVGVDDAGMYSAKRGLNEFFSVNVEMEKLLEGSSALCMTANGYEKESKDGNGFSGASSGIVEFDPAVYGGSEASCEGTTGIIFIGRVGGEGGDDQANVPGSAIDGTGYADGTPHQMALSEYEKEMIRYAKQNCKNTVVVLETSNMMEIGDLMDDESDLSVDAILWVGGPGECGFKAMGEILSGEVNPSGKTVDTWARDVMSNPAMANFGNYEYDDLYLLTGGFPDPVGEPTEMNFLEYEENIYVGYRYYETVDDTKGTFKVFDQDHMSYDEAVLAPFGFGLNYGTEFAQTITDVDENDTEINITVEVTNHGTMAGKDVVQLYFNPPYTEFDIDNKIEKSTVNLIAFEKTDDIEPGASETVELTITKEDMASYSYVHENSDGTLGAYVLEEGDYTISANKNAHEEYDSVVCTVNDTIWYDNENIRQSDKDAQSIWDEEGNPTDVPAASEADEEAEFKAASNLFQDMTDHMADTDQLTRAGGTLTNTATSPTAEDCADVPEEFYYTTGDDGKKTLQQIDLDTDKELGNVEGSKVYTDEMPVTNADQVLTLADLRGKSYYDPSWDNLLDQLDLSEDSLYVALAASYDQTAAIQSVSKPATVDYDGTMGIVGNVLDITTEYVIYPTQPVVASTFNKELAYAQGESVGLEAASHDVNGWYAPGANIHRTAFSGRNFEYYSEDPVLSGYLAAAVVEGASSEGVMCNLKHFALNDEEMYQNDRSRTSIWANEQAIREIYLKPFEMVIKNAKMDLKYVNEDGESETKVMRGTYAVMGCMNYWGTVFGGASYPLLTDLLRNEWGFQGFVITDMMMNAGSNSVDATLRAGNDTFMAWGDSFASLIEDHSTPTGVSVIRRAVKNMCYSIANSRAMNGLAPGTVITYKTSPWKIWLAAGDTIIGLFIVIMIVVMVRRTKDSKAHPELYKPLKKKKVE